MKNNILNIVCRMFFPLCILTGMVSCNKTMTNGADQRSQVQEGAIYRDVTVVDARTMILDHMNNPDFIVLDVRTRNEFDSGHVENAVNLDFYAATFRDDLDALDKSKTYLVYCRSGGRSGQATAIMQDLNFTEVYNMLGGIIQWIAAGYTVVQ